MDAAKGQGNVTAQPPSSDPSAERGDLPQQDADVFATLGLPDDRGGESPTGHAKDGDAAKASAATASAAPNVLAPTTPLPAAAAANAAPASGIVQVDKVETLLQTVQDTAQRAQLDRTGQVELRVRLEGVADDVTVRVHLDENKQAQVSFQTGSAELRAALEQGWNDLTAGGTAASAGASLNVPDFSAPQPAPATAFADAAPSTPAVYREGRRFSDATASSGGQSARRWSGYA